MVLAYHGRYEALSMVRRACGVSRDGASAKSIVAAARNYGLTPRARRLELEDLPKCSLPAILHWRMEHFVVLERMEASGAAHIVDPASGARRVDAQELDRSFTGICLEFTPSVTFKRLGQPPSAIRRVLDLTGSMRKPLFLLAWTALAIDLLSVATPVGTQVLIDQVIGARHGHWLLPIALVLLGAVGLGSLYAVLRDLLALRIRRFLDERLTTDFIEHLFELPIGFFAQRSTGDLVGRVKSLRDIRELIGQQGPSMLVEGLMLFGYLAVMLVFEVRLTLLVVFIALLYVLAFLISRPMLEDGAQQKQLKDTSFVTSLIGALRGMATVKAVGAERRARTDWLNTFIGSLNASTSLALKQQGVTILLTLLKLLALVLVLWFGGLRVLRGELSIGTLVGFQLLQAGFLSPLERLVTTFLKLQALPAVLARLDDVTTYQREPSGQRKAPQLRGQIEVKNLTFRYAELSAPVLRDISLTIKRGSKVAFVGGSGSGKSTLAKLLLGLYAPSCGTILYDGQDLATLDLESVRRQLGVVLQDTALFDGTIADNLRLSSPDAPMEQVIAAARVAQIHADIEALPGGYDTHIMERSGPMSGGQRQRLALTRAILHHPPILILDEATSALDTLTEAAIERYLTTRRCTRVVIAHRLSTVRDADQIFVFDRGELVESGRHEQLVAAKGVYARLVAAEAAARQPVQVVTEKPIADIELGLFRIFADFDAEEKQAIAEQLERRIYRPGDVIVEQDEKPPGLYLLVEGSVAIELIEPGLPKWTVAELKAGDLFGEISMLDGSPSSASARATSAVCVLHLPFARFADMSMRADAQAAKLLLALGTLVTERLRQAMERELSERRTVGAASGSHASLPAVAISAGKQSWSSGLDSVGSPSSSGILKTSSVASVAAATSSRLSESTIRRRTHAMRLRETMLCATMSAEEIAIIERTGTLTRLRKGQPLYDIEAPAAALYVVLSGRIAYRGGGSSSPVDILDPGDLLGETSVFDELPPPFEAVAVADTELFAIDRAKFRLLVLSGGTAGQKALGCAASVLVMQLRLANFRLRELVASQRGEIRRALRAREQALEAVAAGRTHIGLGAESEDSAHELVRTSDPDQSCAACLTTLLRQLGRPIALGRVHEAFERLQGSMAARLAAAAPSLGVFARRLDLLPGELANLEYPLIAQLQEDRFCVLVPQRRGYLVLDPLSGPRQESQKALEASFTGVAFEVLEEVSERRSLGERVREFFAEHWSSVLKLAGLAVAVDGIAVLLSMSTALLIGGIVPLADFGLLRILFASSIVALGVYALCSYFQSRALEWIRAHFDRSLVDQMARHLVGLPLEFFDKHPPGDVLQRFMAFDTVRRLISAQGAPALFSLITLIVSALLLVVMSPQLGWLCLGAVVLYALAARLLLPGIKSRAQLGLDTRMVEFNRMIETIANVATLRLCGDRRLAFRRYRESFEPALAATISADAFRTLGLTALESGKSLVLASIVLWGAALVRDGQLELGRYAAAVGITTIFLATLHGLTVLLMNGTAAGVEYALARETFAELPEQRSGLRIIPGRLRGFVSLQNVSYSYEPGGPLVLKDVSLEVRAGAKVAIVGSSGSGKSTLGKLLLGLYMPTQGRVLFDGKDITNLDLQALRSQIGVVMQEPYLLAGSLRENLTLGSEPISFDRVIEATKRAALHDDIEALPMGYSTMVAEGGGSFSGGQRQRCVLARALIARPAILLLDEATSALDSLSQSTIEAHLAELRVTRIVIAHRLSTVRDADLIVVMDKGRVAETGTHDALMARGGAYARLIAAQL